MKQQIIIHSKALGGCKLRGIYEFVEQPVGALLLSHNLTGNLNHVIVKLLSEEAKTLGFASLRYNFHFVNSLNPNKANFKDILQDAEAAFAKLQQLAPKTQYYLFGKSLGGVVSLYLAINYPELVKGVGIFALPIDIFGKNFKQAELKKIKGKVVIFQGENDEFGTPHQVNEFIREYIKNLQVIKIPRASHGFEAEKNYKENKKLVKKMFSHVVE